jgi:two-component system, NtrC family, response regulator HupR/HoxA
VDSDLVSRSLAAVLQQRGYALVSTSKPQLIDGEVFRIPLPGGSLALAVSSESKRSAVELELVSDLVRAVIEAGSPRAKAPPALHRMLGRSPAMQALYELIDRLASAATTTTVLIQGENGTGKELVAHAIHERSPRRALPFVAANCSAFNDNLLDSELFGHARGAFTGASSDKPGLFESADLGTFFLDEIGDMSPALQAKVLRVLQDGTFHRVGDPEPLNVDVRIIAATNRDLGAMVKAGQFREDLYYRINAITVMVPALRDRRDDIPLLIEAFLDRRGDAEAKVLSAACAKRMVEYSWPGNVRELENEVERLIVLAGSGKVIDVDLLTPRIRDAAVRVAPMNAESLPEAIELLEREMIAAALLRHRGNKSRAAQTLQVSRRNLIRLVQKYRLEAT